MKNRDKKIQAQYMIHFTKLHGNGNDFILIDEYKNQIIPEN